MALVKPTTKNSPAIHTGNAKNNKQASEYTGFKYPSGSNDDRTIYKQPMPNPNGDMKDAVVKSGKQLDASNISVGGTFKAQKGDDMDKNGSWEFRGAGAAVKGRKSYGPLA